MTKYSILFKFLTPLLFVTSLSLVSCGGEDARKWQDSKKEGTIGAVDTFLQNFPDSKYRTAALEHKEDLIWNNAMTDNTEYLYRKYQYDYPQGKYLDLVNTKIEAITIDPQLTLEALTSKTFVGTIKYSEGKEVSVVALKFVNIEEAEGEVRFEASINTNEMRKNIQGVIQKSNFLITFNENPTDQVTLNLSPGRAYWRESRIWLESVDPTQFWRLR